MLMNKKVLIVDNDPDFLDTRAERLEAEGYHVYRAFSLEQAGQLLENTWVHVAIVDIRMTNDDDENDTSGLDLAKQEAYRPIPKIILTRYPSFEQVREALGPALEGLPPAVAFVAKQEGPRAMLRAVEQAFANHARVNWNLTIDWNDLLSFHHLVNLIEPDQDSARLLDRAGELEDLFRKLFYDNNQITVGRLLTHGERRIFLEVFAYGEVAAERQFVLSCGQKWAINTEVDRYETFVPKGAGTGSTSRVKSAETLHFAATVYTLVGGDLEEIVTFREYYQSRSTEEVVASLDHLFKATLAPWYKKGQFYEDHRATRELYLDWLELSEEDRFQRELEHRMEVICREALAAGLTRIDYSPYKLTLQLSDGSSVSYPNPVAALHEGGIVSGLPALCGITLGRVDIDTVLVDSHGQTWLVDFTHAGRGLLLRDFVSLETAISLDVLKTNDLHVRHAFERWLLDAAELDSASAADDRSPELRQALSAIACIRHLAAVIADSDLKPYLAGLFFCVIKRIATYDPHLRYTRLRLVPYAHALLLAAMLYEKLAGLPQRPVHLPDQALNSLWIDEANKEVWVEGRRVDLTPQEFRILAYLYEHAGQLCPRQAITEGALGDEYDISEESRFNSALSRLRQKIEPDPDSPKFIITKRGHGYKLELPR